jgi:hypothetical protein
MEPTLQCTNVLQQFFPQISKTMMQKAAKEVGLLSALHKKLIK